MTTSGGQVARYRPAANETDYLADRFDQLYGVAIGPGGVIVFAELGTGRVHALRSGDVETLASGLHDPVGVAIDQDGAPLVAESGAGRVVKLTGSGSEVLVDGLQKPQGILVRDGQLYIVDAGAKEVIAFDLNSKARQTIASGLPVGAPPGSSPSRSRACRRSPARRARSPASPRDPMARYTFRPTRTAACWRCGAVPERLTG